MEPPVRSVFSGPDCPFIEPNQCNNELPPLPCCERHLEGNTSLITTSNTLNYQTLLMCVYKSCVS